MVLQRKTDLALLALRRLADAQGPLSGAVLAKQVGTSLQFLPQVMAPLVQAGWVNSERGPGGGYHLNESALDARLLNVIEATEGPVDDGRCMMREGPCPGNPSCPAHVVWAEARAVLRQGFEDIPAILVTKGSV